MRSWWRDDTVFEISLQVNGKWKIIRKYGEKTYIASGKYLEVKPPQRLQYTYTMPQFSENEDMITIKIEEKEGGSYFIFEKSGPDIETELAALSENEISESEKGWQQGFDLIGKTYTK